MERKIRYKRSETPKNSVFPTQKPAAGEKKLGVLGPLATIPPLLFTISEQGGNSC